VSNSDTFAFDLLNRLCAIQRTIQVKHPDNTAPYKVKFAVPRWWEPIGNNAMPGFYNRATRLGSAPAGAGMRKDTYLAVMRLAIGPAFAGYKGEYEDAGNLLYVATLNRFERDLKLGDPAAPMSTPLDFVESARLRPSDNGIEGKEYGSGLDSLVYLCIDFSLEVVANFRISRTS
jgi:hypothetical protein